MPLCNVVLQSTHNLATLVLQPKSTPEVYFMVFTCITTYHCSVSLHHNYDLVAFNEITTSIL